MSESSTEVKVEHASSPIFKFLRRPLRIQRRGVVVAVAILVCMVAISFWLVSRPRYVSVQSGSDNVALTQGLEQQISKQLTSDLNQILGPGNAVVIVHANLSGPMQVHGYTVGVILNADDPRVTPEMLTEIRSFVMSAVGISVGNGSHNDISVMSIPFHRYGTSIVPWLRNPWVDGGLVLLIVVIGTLLIIRLGRQRFLTAATVEDVPSADGTDMQADRLEQELAELAVQRPDEFANLLRTWLTE